MISKFFVGEVVFNALLKSTLETNKFFFFLITMDLSQV